MATFFIERSIIKEGVEIYNDTGIELTLYIDGNRKKFAEKLRYVIGYDIKVNCWAKVTEKSPSRIKFNTYHPCKKINGMAATLLSSIDIPVDVKDAKNRTKSSKNALFCTLRKVEGNALLRVCCGFDSRREQNDPPPKATWMGDF